MFAMIFGVPILVGVVVGLCEFYHTTKLVRWMLEESVNGYRIMMAMSLRENQGWILVVQGLLLCVWMGTFIVPGRGDLAVLTHLQRQWWTFQALCLLLVPWVLMTRVLKKRRDRIVIGKIKKPAFNHGHHRGHE